MKIVTLIKSGCILALIVALASPINTLAFSASENPKYKIQADTLLPATLITSIDNIDTTSPRAVVAQVDQNIYDTATKEHLLIPQGSKLLGEYTYHATIDHENKSTQTKISMVFTRIIRPDGASIALTKKPLSASLDKRTDTEGTVNDNREEALEDATASASLHFSAGSVNKHEEVTELHKMALPQGFKFNIVIKKEMALSQYSSRL